MDLKHEKPFIEEQLKVAKANNIRIPVITYFWAWIVYKPLLCVREHCPKKIRNKLVIIATII